MKPFLIFIFQILCLFSVKAHPIPDLPVMGDFNKGGKSSLTLSIDTRCFTDDPEEIPFLSESEFDAYSDEEKENLLVKARLFVKNSLLVKFNDGEWFLPGFKYDFEKRQVDEQSEDSTLVFIRGFHPVDDEFSIQNYQIKAREEASYDLVFINSIDGKTQKRINVLWPGEESFILDLSSFQADQDNQESNHSSIDLASSKTIAEEEKRSKEEGGASTFLSFLRQGFVHVVPLGLDHILFVLGIYMLSRKFRPLLLQVSIFTVAHTLTLGLATLDLVSASSHWVEPIIAASIAVVAIENIFFPEYRQIRLLVVFFFGLVHGLGFAGALSAFNLDPTSLVIGLLGFNIGVEFGQLAVIALVFGATFWVSDAKIYRKWVVVPGSSLIALIGIYWTIERVFS